MSFAVISPGPLTTSGASLLAGVGVHAAGPRTLEVEHDVGHVLLDAVDRRELVGDALGSHARERRSGEGREQYAAQRVSNDVAEAAVKRLDRRTCHRFCSTDSLVIPGIWRSSIRVLTSFWCRTGVGGRPAREPHPGGRGRLNGPANYFEYSSTMSCSCTGAATSRPLRHALPQTVSDSWSACSHAGICPVNRWHL